MNEAYQWVGQATRQAGRTVESVVNNSFVRTVGGAVGLSGLINAVDRVDVTEVERIINTLKAEHPGEPPAQLAQRVITEKALYAGGLGLASSVVPGFLAGLLAIDLAANLLVQAQMVYQIAALYGLDLKDTDRKGEVVMIFGLASGTNQALKLGLRPLVSLPVIGTVLSAGTNAATLYGLGYAACRFYEAKLNASANEPTLMTAS